MHKFMLLGTALFFLGGCAGSPLGDAMTGKEKLAEQDDAYCKSIGAKAGTDTYTKCRMFKTEQREIGHRQSYAHVSRSFSNAGRSMRQSSNRGFNCTSNTFGNTTNTSCR